MLYKLLAIAAVAAAPMMAHAQGTTVQTQDTTAMGHTQAAKDSAGMSSMHMAPMKMKTKSAMHDSTSMHASMHTRMHTRMHADSTMNVSPVDSARMGMPSTRQMKTPPR